MLPLQEAEFVDELNAIKQADLPDVERLKNAFNMVMRRTITLYEQDVELARALQDTDLLVKNQIKLETTRSARAIFQFCYQSIIGGSASND